MAMSLSSATTLNGGRSSFSAIRSRTIASSRRIVQFAQVKVAAIRKSLPWLGCLCMFAVRPTGAAEILACQRPTSSCFEFSPEFIAQRDEIMRVETCIRQQVRRERTLSPIRFLETLVHDHIEIFFKRGIQSNFFITQNSLSLHCVEDVRKSEAEIAVQADQIIFRGVEDFFDARVGKNRRQRIKVDQRQWVDEIIRLGRGKLDKTNLLAVGVQGIGLGVHCNPRLAQ